MEEKMIAREQEMLNLNSLNCRMQAAISTNISGNLATIEAKAKKQFWLNLEQEYQSKKIQEIQNIQRFYREQIESLPHNLPADKAG